MIVVYYAPSFNVFSVTGYNFNDVKPYSCDASWWIVPGTINLEA